MSQKTSKSIPDTTEWQPRENVADSLQNAFAKSCLGSEKIIRIKSQLERQMNVDNYDSGLGIEDIVREEFRKLCPSRYSISCGVINDRYGRTAGDFDLIVFNEFWFPQVKSGATPASRRVHFPIEGVYAVGEIKQALDFASLDKAMKKTVSCHRLNRPTTSGNRLVENRENNIDSNDISNPLYSFILATELGEGIKFDDIVNRFFDINKSLKRLEVVRCLCVLGHGTVIWGVQDKNINGIKPALFMSDLAEPIFPVMQRLPEVDSAFFPLMLNLLLHLFHSVLAPEDIAASYGYQSMPVVQAPDSSEFWLMPDKVK